MLTKTGLGLEQIMALDLWQVRRLSAEASIDAELDALAASGKYKTNEGLQSAARSLIRRKHEELDRRGDHELGRAGDHRRAQQD